MVGQHAQESTQITNETGEQPLNLFPKTADLKIQLLRVFDVLQHAARLKEVQREYEHISGNKYNIRETMRSLHKSALVRMIREKNNSRGIMWVKTEWLENGQLLDKYKPEGFDMLYKPDNLIYE